MKIRDGFVSNSSSSSFMMIFSAPEVEKNLMNLSYDEYFAFTTIFCKDTILGKRVYRRFVLDLDGYFQEELSNGITPSSEMYEDLSNAVEKLQKYCGEENYYYIVEEH